MTLLIDADGTLFGSEEPAFDASVHVINALLAELGAKERYDAETLRRRTTGSNFRTTACKLAAQCGHPLAEDALERWVAAELLAVTDHLSATLEPDPEVREVLERLACEHRLAVVTSSALSRLDACLRATGLDHLFAEDHRFSAEDSLPRPTSKPDPAVYLHACSELGVEPEASLAIEDSATGAGSAVAAGVPTIGILRFVAPAERADRDSELRRAGVTAVVETWADVEAQVNSAATPPSLSAARASR